jgi:diguanylate cyclase (GGDEF)-like protein
VETDWRIGPFFWIHLVYSFLLILVSDIIIFEQAWLWSNKYKREAVILTIGTLFPLFTNAALTFNFFPGIKGNYDVVGFVIAGLLFFWGLFNEQMLDITPIAHQILVENMPDAIFMFDEQQRLVDINPAGLAFLDLPFEQAIACTPQDLFDPPISIGENDQTTEYCVSQHQREQWYEVLSIPLQHQEHRIGYLLTLRDISQQHRLTEELRLLATTDSLTGLTNRRHFMEQSIQYLHHALRYGHDLSLIMLDIDFFKNTNDEFGHAVGDQILIKLTEVLAQNIRSVDILCRYGGEEFCILLPETALEAAHPMAERLRWLVKETSFNINGVRHRISISLGVTSLQNEKVSMDILLNRADHAMYHAKRNGRDQVMVWNVDMTLKK